MKIAPEFSDDTAREMTDEDHKEIQVYGITQIYALRDLLKKVFTISVASLVINAIQAILLLLK